MNFYFKDKSKKLNDDLETSNLVDTLYNQLTTCGQIECFLRVSKYLGQGELENYFLED